MDDNHIKYQDFDVAQDKAAREEMLSKSRQMSVPTIIIDGEVVVGFNEKLLKEKLGI